MHFRIYDLAAGCVWSIPPIDTVPVKLRGQKLVVRAIDNDGGVFEVASVDGVRLSDLATQFLADRKVSRLNIHLAADDFMPGEWYVTTTSKRCSIAPLGHSIEVSVDRAEPRSDRTTEGRNEDIRLFADGGAANRQPRWRTFLASEGVPPQ